MNDRGFTTTFTVDRTPREAFAAITDVHRWWSAEIDGGTAEIGDEFTYRYQENYFDFTQDTTEWTGTLIPTGGGQPNGRPRVAIEEA